MSSLTKVWPATVVAFVLHNLSTRRERREMPSAARAAAFRARRQASSGIADSRAAGAKYACDLLNFAASAGVAPSPRSEIVQKAVREAEETDAWRTLAQVEPRAGVPLERLLPGRGVEFLLMREILDTDVVSSSAEECLLALLIATKAPLLCKPRQYRSRRTSSRRT